MIKDTEPVRCPDVDLVVIDRDRTRIALTVDDWNATILLACVSEDPKNWSDLAGVWGRYRIGPGALEVEDLDFDVIDFESAISQLSNERAWLVIDLRSKRVCAGKVNDPMERDGCYAMDNMDMDTDEDTDDGTPYRTELRIPVHLPPWWEFHTHVELSMIGQPRREAMKVFRPQRDVLWGPELSKGLAERMLASFAEDEKLSDLLSNLSSDFSDPDTIVTKDDETANRLRELRNELHEKTVAVHRDWLMTPRSDLDGRMPRECLHGGRNWIDLVIEGQKWQASSEATMTPIPDSMANDPNVPMGRSEICLYFDLCRELIKSGWIYLSLRGDNPLSIDPKSFAVHLAEVQQSWMKLPFEEGPSPSSIIQAERQRLPRVLDAEHIGDCDCPICEIMKIGSFGPSFVGIDGHHLELDNEFAFSLDETREEWEENQCRYGELSDSMSENWLLDEHDDTSEDSDETGEKDEFGSVWKSTFVAQGGIPGDSKGHIEISFLLADMISTLKHVGLQNDVDQLNQAFREYRGAGQYELAVATEQFQQVLEQVAQRHSDLVSRSADLQQRLDELARRMTEFDSEDDSY